MCKRPFDNFALGMGDFGGPLIERAAQAVNRRYRRRRGRDAYCIGSGQTLHALEDSILRKVSDFGEAAQTLAALSGQTHRLTSAFCRARAGKGLVVHSSRADVRMRALDAGEIWYM
jgi:predicted house-cleaning NTP pyrophosphatase (Maf/HAM1 superfamily)